MPTRLELELTTAPQAPPRRRRDDAAPMRLLLCGDFAGRAARGLDDPAGLAARPLLRVDVDNLEQVMARVAPVLEYPIDGRSARIGFASLQDFHPDRLCERTGLFAGLTATHALASNASAETSAPPQPNAGADTAESDADTLDRLLGRPVSAPGATRSQPAAGAVEAAVDALVRRIAASDTEPRAPSEPAASSAALDAARSERLRALLHAPRFQALESAWRTVHLLVSRLELGQELQLYLFDVTRAELAATAAEQDLQRAGLWKALVESGDTGADPLGWSMIVSLEAFDASRGDIAILAAFAATAAATGAPLVATAAPQLLSCERLSLAADADDWQPLDADSAARWRALRESPLAPWIGLAAPRLLLRLPYGARSDPLDGFDFEELAGIDTADGLLWGQPGAVCALLAGLAFLDAGWTMDLDMTRDLDDLPAWVYEVEGERRLYPCAEAWLGERAAGAMLGRGVMPLLSRRDRPAVRLLRWQSIAAVPTALNGAWGR